MHRPPIASALGRKYIMRFVSMSSEQPTSAGRANLRVFCRHANAREAESCACAVQGAATGVHHSGCAAAPEAAGVPEALSAAKHAK